MQIKKLIKNNISLIKYFIVGIINTLVSLIVIAICMYLFNLKYDTSNIIGYVIGLINSFIWNKNWVFKKRESNELLKEIVLFLLVFLLCFGIQFLSLKVMVEKLNLQEYISQVIAMIIYTIPSYFLNRFITFKQKNNL
ncbi:MAG: GtrA family protein [Bacteroidales bacterium]|jgi:putative flippase GtrA|nr:GtrA family protein [Bacteroidales bacterium]